jgi:hypothetical protein
MCKKAYVSRTYVIHVKIFLHLLLTHKLGNFKQKLGECVFMAKKAKSVSWRYFTGQHEESTGARAHPGPQHDAGGQQYHKCRRYSILPTEPQMG